MHRLTFYPLGNADCCLLSTANDRLILFDYANMRSNDDDDKRCDLPNVLRNELDEVDRDSFDVVAFTHADKDHINGFSDFFYLEHAKKYQGEDRIKIDELWVPAAVILEKSAKDEHQILRAEARYRFKQGKGIRVFSKPDLLTGWLNEQGIYLWEREHLITNAGKLVPGYTMANQGIEFFVHSPFSKTIDNKIVRNDAALVMHVTFSYGGEETSLILGADIAHEIWTDIVKITQYYGQEERLKWDIFKLSHHCSYLSLSNEKGETKTEPVSKVAWLFDQGNTKGVLISTSKPVPHEDSKQPPHIQAARYYQDVAQKIGGQFIITMEHPTESSPEPLIIKIDQSGATRSISPGIVSFISSRSAPRAG